MSLDTLQMVDSQRPRHARGASEQFGAKYQMSLPSAKSQYNNKLDSYNAKLQSPKFANNSSGMGGVLGARESGFGHSRQEQASLIQQKMNKISHLLA